MIYVKCVVIYIKFVLSPPADAADPAITCRGGRVGDRLHHLQDLHHLQESLQDLQDLRQRLDLLVDAHLGYEPSLRL